MVHRVALKWTDGLKPPFPVCLLPSEPPFGLAVSLLEALPGLRLRGRRGLGRLGRLGRRSRRRSRLSAESEILVLRVECIVCRR